MEPLTNTPTDLVLVGHVTGAFGVQGWVKIHPYSADASALLHAKTWWLGKRLASTESGTDGAVHDVEKLEAKLHGDDIVARIMGIANRTAAEALKGQVVKIQRSHFPVLSDNEFYWLDLIGLTVKNLQGENLGVVADLIDNGAHPILRVVLNLINLRSDSGEIAKKADSEREYLIPFVAHFVPDVDQKNRTITVDWGLDY